jgi:hypothetical protein
VLAVAGVLERRVFSVGGREFRWSDVADTADWDDLRRTAGNGLAALAAAPPTDGEVQEAGARFRYDRNLVAGEEMEAWLRRWELTVQEWRGYLARTLARGRAGTAEAVEPDERAVWAEAVCSGTLERLAQELAARAAAAQALGEDDLDRAFARFVADAQDHRTLESLLEIRKADWLRVDCRTLVLDSETAAREAALCVRDDGMALAEVSAQAGVAMREHSLYVEDAADQLGKALLSARTGELLGPLPLADRYALVLVDGKVEPALDDPEILRRVQEAARRRAIEREVVSRVTWHERV